MKFWKDLSFAEQIAKLNSLGRHGVDEAAKECFFATSRLLADDEIAVRMVWRPMVNDFLINKPEEVAAYCRELAAIERRNARLPEALALCRQRLNELHGTNMADDIRNESVDDEGFWFSYKVWNKARRQKLYVLHTDLPLLSQKEVQ